jgi:tetratricopeptide (TPR) repeat protein
MQKASVSMSEETLHLRTFLLDPPNLVARYYEGNQHQGVQERYYPYPMNDGLTDQSAMKSYKAVCLENDYIKISVIPELGGRIFSAYDKVTKYDFIYRQDVIKHALVGMVGAWITGAIAWGFPHHHGPLTIAPFDYCTKDNADGSKTVWVSKFDLRHRLRELIGITLRPDTNVLGVAVTLLNATPVENTFLFWTNPAVKPDPTFRIFFDPSVQWATYHGKIDMAKWPIAEGDYRGIDYKGVDISLWKNVKSPTSFFAFNAQGDFFGGYSYEREAGIAYVGNHHITPGMKCWEYGPNPEGDAWIRMCTDKAGHNIEMMAGAYSDNQPDYSFIRPYETKHFKQHWFPLNKLGGLKYANLNGALNLVVEPSRAMVRVNVTSKRDGAKIVLECKGKPLFEKTLDISPEQPFLHDVALPGGVSETDLKLSVYASSGELLLSYQPLSKANMPRPKTYEFPGDPKQFGSVEELYLTGLRLVQFYNNIMDPQPYFDEALRRDPGHYGTNTFLGILDLKHKMWREAEQKLRTAVDRATFNYTRPKSCEATFYLALVQKLLGKTKEAYDNFYRATWDNAWHTPAYAQLAELDFRNGDYARAVEHLDRAISTNSSLLALQVNRAVALRKLGGAEAARQALASVAERDLLDFYSRNELCILDKQADCEGAAKRLDDLRALMRDDVQSYLELATQYLNLALYDEAIDVLTRLERAGSTFPMVYYYLGYLCDRKGDKARAAHYNQLAATMPWEYCFPFRDEEVLVLEYAQQANPSDAKAGYFLGCLLYENDPARAIHEWEKSAAIDNSFSYTFRNLAWGYHRHAKDLPKAIAAMEKAIALSDQDARFFYEMDVLYQTACAPIEKRLQMLESHSATVKKRDDSLLRLALVYVHAGKYDEAIHIFDTNHFHYWEGISTATFIFMDAHILRGIRRLKEKRYDEALEDFTASFSFPPNLDMGTPPRMSRFCELYYYTGLALEALGRKEEADEYLQEAADEIVDDSCYLYHQGLALRKLGRENEAERSFAKLAEYCKKGKGFFGDGSLWPYLFNLTDREWRAQNLYSIGLAHLAKGMKKEATEHFQQASKTSPHVWADFMLKEQSECSCKG